METLQPEMARCDFAGGRVPDRTSRKANPAELKFARLLYRNEVSYAFPPENAQVSTRVPAKGSAGCLGTRGPPPGIFRDGYGSGRPVYFDAESCTQRGLYQTGFGSSRRRGARSSHGVR